MMSYRMKFTTALDQALIQKIKIQAIREQRSVADILNEILAKYLETKAATIKEK